jgi:hypothetical protein
MNEHFVSQWTFQPSAEPSGQISVPLYQRKREHSLFAAYQRPSLKVSRLGVSLPFVMGYQTEGMHWRAFHGVSDCDCVSSPPS